MLKVNGKVKRIQKSGVSPNLTTHKLNAVLHLSQLKFKKALSAQVPKTTRCSHIIKDGLKTVTTQVNFLHTIINLNIYLVMKHLLMPIYLTLIKVVMFILDSSHKLL